MKLVKSIIFLVCFSSSFVFADTTDLYPFSNPQQQQVFAELMQELRCLVCQNQNLADSNAALASDLRREVYARLQQGSSKQQIIKFLTDRYGEFVLFKPRVQVKTLVLWYGPFVMLMFAFIVVILVMRRGRKNI